MGNERTSADCKYIRITEQNTPLQTVRRLALIRVFTCILYWSFPKQTKPLKTLFRLLPVVPQSWQYQHNSELVSLRIFSLLTSAISGTHLLSISTCIKVPSCGNTWKSSFRICCALCFNWALFIKTISASLAYSLLPLLYTLLFPE